MLVGTTTLALVGLMHTPPPENSAPAGASASPDPGLLDHQRQIDVDTEHAQHTDNSSSTVTSVTFAERLPRSTPDALRFEPGVYIQQTSHAQASPYVRGLTGQQVGLFLDGIRLNNSTFRQGPNQYLSTVDLRTLDRIEVVRGGASTRWGSDAIGGVILATPIEPQLNATHSDPPLITHGTALFYTGTADGTVGGRAQLEVSYRDRIGFLVGFGGRTVGLLRSGGRIDEPATGEPQRVPPAFESDGKTQQGTGFDEYTTDARVIWRIHPKHRLSVAYYDFRQLDAPRTDRCPPPTAPQDECLTYTHQFRHLAYVAHEHHHGPAWAERSRTTASYQRQYERLDFDRGSPSLTRLDGRNTVHTWGMNHTTHTRDLWVSPWLKVSTSYGADLYVDKIRSTQAIEFEDTHQSIAQSRGQYLDRSRYLTSGLWLESRLELDRFLTLTAGGRGAWVYAYADGDEASSSSAVKQHWTTAVGRTGLTFRAAPWLAWHANFDQGFRAPNLDDLTSRQQTGPGFQFENASLQPERSITFEVGLEARSRWVDVSVWGYRTTIRDLIGRNQVSIEDCPEGSSGCQASQTLFQLQNLTGQARLVGAEGVVSLRAPGGFWARSTVSWAKGTQPDPFSSTEGTTLTVPMSRVPPLHGAAELGWRSWFGLYLSTAIRWATLQDRLAPQDITDPRIPRGGTPGYVIWDLRATYRLKRYILFTLLLENLTDTPYRNHGSSLNGPGRSVLLESRFGF